MEERTFIKLTDPYSVIWALKKIMAKTPKHDLKSSGLDPVTIRRYKNGGGGSIPITRTFSEIIKCYDLILKLRDFKTNKNVYGERRIVHYLYNIYETAPLEIKEKLVKPSAGGMLFETLFTYIRVIGDLGLAIVDRYPSKSIILLNEPDVREIKEITDTQTLPEPEVLSEPTILQSHDISVDQINGIKEFISSNLDAYGKNWIDKDTLIKIINDSLSRI